MAKILPKADRRAKNGNPGGTLSTAKPKTVVESVRSDKTMTGNGLKTLDGMVMGTPQFMAPEQARGAIEQIDERTDVYALGAILYSILTLHPPIAGKDLDEMLENVAQGHIAHPSTYQAGRDGSASRPRRFGLSARGGQSRPTADTGLAPVHLAHCSGGRIPEALIALTLKALALEPKTRYSRVIELQRDIEAYQTGFAVSAEQASLGRLLWLLIKRHKTATGLVGSVLLLIIVGLLSLLWIARSEQRRAQTELALIEEQQRRLEAWLPVVAADFAAGDPIPEGFEAVWGNDADREMFPAEENRIRILDGALTFRDAGLKILRWPEPVGANPRIDAWVADLGTLQLAVGGDAVTGYRAVFDFQTSRSVWLDEGARQDWRILQSGRITIPERETHHLRVQKTGQHIRIHVNDEPALEYFDPIPKSGVAHRNFSLSSWANDARVVRFEVHRRRDPEYVSALEEGRGLLRRGHLEDALDFFEGQLGSQEDPDQILQARLLLGVTLARMNRPVEAIPHLERVVAESAGDEAVRGAALLETTRLYTETEAWDRAVDSALRARSIIPGSQAPDLVVNRIVAHLRAQALPKTIDVETQAVSRSSHLGVSEQRRFLRYLGRLEPTTLELSRCGLSTLEGVGSPRLRNLNVDNNDLSDLSPLAGLNLESFNCAGNRIEDLSPLKGMPLTSLYCGGNLIEDLSPLAGMPLTWLHCGGNRIADLSPLAGMPLTYLACSGNRIDDLSVLSGMPLIELGCAGNRIRDLSPLAKLPLRSLRLKINPIEGDLSVLEGNTLQSLIIDLSVLTRHQDIAAVLPNVEWINHHQVDFVITLLPDLVSALEAGVPTDRLMDHTFISGSRRVLPVPSLVTRDMALDMAKRLQAEIISLSDTIGDRSLLDRLRESHAGPSATYIELIEYNADHQRWEYPDGRPMPRDQWYSVRNALRPTQEVTVFWSLTHRKLFKSSQALYHTFILVWPAAEGNGNAGDPDPAERNLIHRVE